MKRITYGRAAAEQPVEIENLDTESLKQKIHSRLSDLDTMPFVYRKLLSLLNSPFVSARDLGKVISTDQSLSIRVLRMVNSAYYGVTQRVMSVTQAVSMLGLNVVRSLCFCLASYDSFFAGTGNDQAMHWKRAMGTGLVAKNLAKLARQGCPEELFVAGMLHDVGYSVLRKYAPREHGMLMAKLAEAEDPLEAERQFLGTDHAEIGATTCEAWKLPEMLIECVRYHHSPNKAGKHEKPAALVALACSAWEGQEINSLYLELLDLTVEEVERAVAAAQDEFCEIGNYVGLGANSRAS